MGKINLFLSMTAVCCFRYSRRWLSVFAALIFLGLFGLPPLAVGGYTFKTITDPSDKCTSQYECSTVANGINNNGQIVGYYKGEGGTTHGFVESGGVFTTLDDPLASSATVATGINDNGQVVGYYFDSGGTHGFLESGGVFTTLDGPSFPCTGLILVDCYSTVASGINNNGQVVGSYNGAAGVSQAFIATDGVFTIINPPSATSTVAYGINNKAQVVGGYTDASGASHVFVESGGVFTSLNYPSGISTVVAQGINDNGQVVGYYFDGPGLTHGFVESGGVFTTLDGPTKNLYGALATGINDSGQVVGYYGYAKGNRGFIASPVLPPANFPETYYSGNYEGDDSGYFAGKILKNKITFLIVGSSSIIEGSAIINPDHTFSGTVQIGAGLHTVFSGQIDTNTDGSVQTAYGTWTTYFGKSAEYAGSWTASPIPSDLASVGAGVWLGSWNARNYDPNYGVWVSEAGKIAFLTNDDYSVIGIALYNRGGYSYEIEFSGTWDPTTGAVQVQDDAGYGVLAEGLIVKKSIKGNLYQPDYTAKVIGKLSASKL
ncbi:MAG: hypothetical protein ACLQVJ_06875 [Syntrophobacteraceae bacterium]